MEGGEVTGGGERKRKQLLGYFMENRGYRKLKEETLGRTLWRTRFGRSDASGVRMDRE